MGKKFPWGKVIENFSYDFDGVELQVTKYHPWVYKEGGVSTRIADTSTIEYHCEEMHASYSSMFAVLVAFIAHKNIGSGNNSGLVIGLCKALEII